MPLLQQHGAVAGSTLLPKDHDAVIRRLPNEHEAFWRQVIAVFRKTRPGVLPERLPDLPAMIRYLGPSHATFPHVSYYRVLKDDAALPADVFKDQIVLVGREAHGEADGAMIQAQSAATPFGAMPGVEIQATVLENVLNRQTIDKAGHLPALLLLVAVLALAGLGGWLFSQRNYWLPLLPALSVLGVVGLIMLVWSWLEQRKRGVDAGGGGYRADSRTALAREGAARLYTRLKTRMLRLRDGTCKMPGHSPDHGTVYAQLARFIDAG